MNLRQIPSALIALMVMSSVLAGAAVAGDLVAQNGETLDSTESADPVVFTKDVDGENRTIQLNSENWQVSAGSSKSFNISGGTVASAEVAQTSGSGTAAVNVVNSADKLYINETGGSSSVTVEKLNVTYNLTNDKNETGFYTGETVKEAMLVTDPDDSVTINHSIVDRFAEIDYSVEGVDAKFNESGNEFVVNETGQAQIVLDLTRNNSTFESYGVETLKVSVALNNSQFSSIRETTSENASRLVLVDKKKSDGQTEFVWEITKPDNTTRNYEVSLNATVESAKYNDSVVVGETHDPNGGVSAEYTDSYDTSAASGVVSPNFNKSPFGLPLWLWAILGVGGIGLAWVTLSRHQNSMSAHSGYMGKVAPYTPYEARWKMALWAVGYLGGILLSIDGMLPRPDFTIPFTDIQPLMMEFDVVSNLLGIGDGMALMLGFGLIVLTAFLNMLSVRSGSSSMMAKMPGR